MSIKLESILPVVVLGFLACAFYFSAKPPEKFGDRKVIPPKMEAPQLIRTEGVVDGKIKVKHIPSGDSFNLGMYDDYFLLPPGENELPKAGDGTKLWEFTYTKPTYWIDPRLEFGVYAGYLDGDKKGTNIDSFDVGLKLSPVRLFFGTTTIDGLVSNQAAGLGASLYPAPIHFGQFWKNMGVGYGRVYTYDDNAQRNLFYLTFSSHF